MLSSPRGMKWRSNRQVAKSRAIPVILKHAAPSATRMACSGNTKKPWKSGRRLFDLIPTGTYLIAASPRSAIRLQASSRPGDCGASFGQKSTRLKLHTFGYENAFLQGDTEVYSAKWEWFRGKPDLPSLRAENC